MRKKEISRHFWLINNFSIELVYVNSCWRNIRSNLFFSMKTIYLKIYESSGEMSRGKVALHG